MKQKLPIVVSVTALVIAVLGITSYAGAHGVFHARFAHNADKVDGKHAVGAGATLNNAAGKLVATQRTGANKGRFARKFINSAYAFVSSPGATPAFDSARTRNFTAITSPATGEYCLTPAAGINPQNSPLVVSVDWSNSSGSDLWVYWRASGAGCSAGQYDVLTFQNPGGNPTQTGTVAFVAYVP